ncbi:hypothetical protein GGR57DRAFT_168446 [Xylariaceae sp. FL1272]|nr:hypothetical protein GGR57DRAFT_168446 [Xylariaceae sp. FL1272]
MEGKQSATSATRAPESQVPNACLVCRARKVRCGREISGCRNCSRLGLPCPGYSRGAETTSRAEVLKSAQDLFSAAGFQKRRIGSCNDCRASKSKCSKDRPSCRRCADKGLPCLYPKHRIAVDSSVSENTDDDHTSNAGDRELYAEVLPEDAGLRGRLIAAYFERIHPLGCLSFIHKPSFMYSFDHDTIERDYGKPLLYTICAIGARCVVEPSGSQARQQGPGPGDAWADWARKEVLADIHHPTTQHVMTLLLLSAYALRRNQHALVYTLIGCLYRAMRLLGLDVEPAPDAVSTPDSLLDRQVKDRLVWAVYIMDSFVASGVDQNSMWRSDIPPIPLPWTDREFLTRTAPRRQYLDPIMQAGSWRIMRHFDVFSLTVVLIKLRNDVLKLIRKTPEDGINIWHPESEFLLLLKKLDSFDQNIPHAYRLSDLNMYVLRDQHLLGAVFQLHLLVNSVIFDLLKISLAGFTFPLAIAFRNAPPEFRSQCQTRCRFHANEVSNLMQRGLGKSEGSNGYQDRAAFDDPFCRAIVFESAKIQVVHTATVANEPSSIQFTRRNLQMTFSLFDLLQDGEEGTNKYAHALLPLCYSFGFADAAREWLRSQTPPNSANFESAAEITGSASIHHLSRGAPFRLAQLEVEDCQASANARTVTSSTNCSEQRLHKFASKQPATVPVQPLPPTNTITNNLAPTYSQSQTPNQHYTGAIAIPADAFTSQHTSEEYIRTADEMSSFLMWANAEPPNMSLYQQWPWMYDQSTAQPAYPP